MLVLLASIIVLSGRCLALQGTTTTEATQRPATTGNPAGPNHTAVSDDLVMSTEASWNHTDNYQTEVQPTDTNSQRLTCRAAYLWPATNVGERARINCMLSRSNATKYCKLGRWLGQQVAIWGRSNYTDCVLGLWRVQEGSSGPSSCPEDSSYATTWPETPGNTTVTAQCPSNVYQIPADARASRRCELRVVDGIMVAKWQDADLDDCLVVEHNIKAPANIAVDDWIKNNSCSQDVTVTKFGTFQWNSTIVGGVATTSCRYGSLIPSREALNFMEVTLRISSVFDEIHQDFMSINTTETTEQISLGISAIGTKMGQFIKNETEEMIESFMARNSTKKILNGVGDWLQENKVQSFLSKVFSRKFSNQSEDMEVKKIANETSAAGMGNFKWLDDLASSLNLVTSFMGALSVWDKKTHSLTYDFRGNHIFDFPLENSVMHLGMGELDENLTSLIKDLSRNKTRDRRTPSSVGHTTKLSKLRDFIESLQFPNTTNVARVFHNLSRDPNRKCEEKLNGQGVAWSAPETWMCRTEDASFSRDVIQAMEETNNFGLGPGIDMLFVKSVLNLCSIVEEVKSAIPQAAMAVIRFISYLLTLSRLDLPQSWKNKMIMKIEALAEIQLSENISRIRIVTDNVVVTMETVEADNFDGALFASIKNNSLKKSNCGSKQWWNYGCFTENATFIGNDVFEQMSGALNDSLQDLDEDRVDEYFYVPRSVFNHNHVISCDTMGSTKRANRSTANVDRSTLQFVVYENDLLFRTYGGAVSVEKKDGPAEWKVASRVISATLGGHYIQSLKEPVVIRLKHHHHEAGDANSRLCVFWDFSARDGFGSWSQDGCVVKNSSRDHTVCECCHLTNFAVIVDIRDQLGSGEMSKEHNKALEIISYSGCALSLIGLTITISLLISNRKLREAKTTPTRIMLCLSMIISVTVYLGGIDQTSNKHACVVFACCIHYFTLVALLWMAVEGIYLFRNVVVVVLSPTRHMFRNCCLLAWGLPAVIVGSAAALDIQAYGGETRCWIVHPYVFFAGFLAPALLIVLFNGVVFIMVLRVYCKRRFSKNRHVTGKDLNESARTCKDVFGIISITALLGLTWIFGGFTAGEDVRLTGLYLFTIANSAQGFSIFIFYGLLSFVTSRRDAAKSGTSPLGHHLPTGKQRRSRLDLATLAQLNNKKTPINTGILWQSELRKASSGDISFITSSTDVHVESGHINPAYQFDNPLTTPSPDCYEPTGKRIVQQAGMPSIPGMPEIPRMPGITPLSFVLSAGILHSGTVPGVLYLTRPAKHGNQTWMGSQDQHKEHFVIGTGIIFSGIP